jgi:hypothetical protein
MQFFYEIALAPIMTAMSNLHGIIADNHIEKAYLVGGTSASTWLGPNIRNALPAGIQIIHPALHPR